MRRAALERDRALREWHKHRALHASDFQALGGVLSNWVPGVSPADLVTCACDNQPGRFRKGQRWSSNVFGNPRTYGERTRQEARSDADFRDQLRELA
jgi:hypothetical protein